MALNLYNWLDSRLRLKPVEQTLLDEPIPGGASWIYVFGSATLFLFFLQAATGMFLALYYAPTPDHAYDSVRYLETEITFRLVCARSSVRAPAMVVAIGLHMHCRPFCMARTSRRVKSCGWSAWRCFLW
ncbi:MAG: hypothetical protein U0361_19895 [Nitrospiraceae bacterium]